MSTVRRLFTPCTPHKQTDKEDKCICCKIKTCYRHCKLQYAELHST